MLQSIMVYLVPGSPSFVKASFLVPCPFFMGWHKCKGHAKVQGLRIGEQSGTRSMRIERQTVRPRCTLCHMRISITKEEREQLLVEARKFLASEIWKREANRSASFRASIEIRRRWTLAKGASQRVRYFSSSG